MGITLAITTWNRDLMTANSYKHVIRDERITEVVIVDDCSDDYWFKSLEKMATHEKVKLYRNEKNLGCYHNKRRAVELSTNEWVILFDSDNILHTDYLDAIDKCSWYDFEILAPTYAKPHFDYRSLANVQLKKGQVRKYMDNPRFSAAINTCNFFVNRSKYLEVFDSSKAEPWTADTLYFNYCWLNSGGTIYFVPGMEYDHLVHDGSHYKANVQKTGNFAEEIMNKLR